MVYGAKPLGWHRLAAGPTTKLLSGKDAQAPSLRHHGKLRGGRPRNLGIGSDGKCGRPETHLILAGPCKGTWSATVSVSKWKR